MAIPASFASAGFIQPAKKRRVLIATEGESESGKSEFLNSAPGPGVVICVDRGHEGMQDNPHPPKSRNPDFVWLPVAIPLAQTLTLVEYTAQWKSLRELYYKALGHADVRTVGLDTDSDTWELQRLAEFGKLTQVPSINYAGINASRKAFITRAYDSGKIVIATNKIGKAYTYDYDAKGSVILDNTGKPAKSWKGDMERQGFPDHNYLWQIQLRHLRIAPQQVEIKIGPLKGQMKTMPPRHGIRILKCKHMGEYEGHELWDDKCNFRSLMELVYPHVSAKEWGYKD